jgi:hypothetical protein
VRYRLYLDESGDHTTTHAVDIGKRYLGLVGVCFLQDAEGFPRNSPYRGFAESFDEFRRSLFGEDPPVFHREEIVKKCGEFSILQDPNICAQFDSGLLEVFRAASCKIFAIVLDKHEHSNATHRTLKHPSHYCLHAMLERYCGFLNFIGGRGDVMAESRGKVEDMALKEMYEYIYNNGTRYHQPSIFQRALTSQQIKIKPKSAGIHGLQLADVLAHPLTRDVLVSYKRLPHHGGHYCQQLSEIAIQKYNKHAYGDRIRGYGRVLLD